MPFLGKIFNQNSDDFGTIIIHLIYAVLRELCLAPERGCFFIRVILIPCNALNVIASHFLGTPRDTVYSRGKGAHKQKSERYRLR